jgi:outer membrane lipoprotein-sorting protein
MPSRAIPLAYRVVLFAALAATLLLSPGCLVRRLKIVRPGVKSTDKLQTATLDQLLARLQTWNQQIQTVTATVDLEPTLGTVLKGEISQLKDIRGYVLIRKPNMIRMFGLYPVVRTRAFDMASNGTDFELFVPVKNKFIVGKNHLDKPSPRKLENLRPQHIFEALVIAPPEKGERAVLENDTDETNAYYIVHLLREEGGRLLLTRNIWFDRVRLSIARQEIFDETGDIVSDSRYNDYDDVRGVAFPKKISVMRPKDEYGVALTVLKLQLNETLGDEKFALTQPPGTELLDLSAPKRPAAKM